MFVTKRPQQRKPKSKLTSEKRSLPWGRPQIQRPRNQAPKRRRVWGQQLSDKALVLGSKRSPGATEGSHSRAHIRSSVRRAEGLWRTLSHDSGSRHCDMPRECVPSRRGPKSTPMGPRLHHPATSGQARCHRGALAGCWVAGGGEVGGRKGGRGQERTEASPRYVPHGRCFHD